MHAKTNAHEQTMILVQCSHNSRWSEGNDKRLFFQHFHAVSGHGFGPVRRRARPAYRCAQCTMARRAKTKTDPPTHGRMAFHCQLQGCGRQHAKLIKCTRWESNDKLGDSSLVDSILEVNPRNASCRRHVGTLRRPSVSHCQHGRSRAGCMLTRCRQRLFASVSYCQLHGSARCHRR